MAFLDVGMSYSNTELMMFLVLAFITGCRKEADSGQLTTEEVREHAAAFVGDRHLDTEAPRPIQGLALNKMGWTYDCMECHQSLEPQWDPKRARVEHQDITLKHGSNKYCLNCHHPTNRNAWKADDGSEIPEVRVEQLCARCHGPTYRDWLAGAHGRVNGYWDSSQGLQTNLYCIECHDPHAPRMAQREPEPGPTAHTRPRHSNSKP